MSRPLARGGEGPQDLADPIQERSPGQPGTNLLRQAADQFDAVANGRLPVPRWRRLAAEKSQIGDIISKINGS